MPVFCSSLLLLTETARREAKEKADAKERYMKVRKLVVRKLLAYCY